MLARLGSRSGVGGCRRSWGIAARVAILSVSTALCGTGRISAHQGQKSYAVPCRSGVSQNPMPLCRSRQSPKSYAVPCRSGASQNPMPLYPGCAGSFHPLAWPLHWASTCSPALRKVYFCRLAMRISRWPVGGVWETFHPAYLDTLSISDTASAWAGLHVLARLGSRSGVGGCRRSWGIAARVAILSVSTALCGTGRISAHQGQKSYAVPCRSGVSQNPMPLCRSRQSPKSYAVPCRSGASQNPTPLNRLPLIREPCTECKRHF